MLIIFLFVHIIFCLHPSVTCKLKLFFILGRATSPPSFALEVFVQCEGETRFRRLCPPCLYSHSSSNVLEVEVYTLSSNALSNL